MSSFVRYAVCTMAALGLAIEPSQAQSEPVIHVAPVIVADTPLAADAAGASQISLPAFTPQALRSLSNLADGVANLNLSSSGAGSYGGLISLRGLANTPYFSDPSVAVYFDDLPLGSSFTYPVDLFGFGSVTVTRGPQPALAGRASEAGLIQFSSKLPADVASGALHAGIGNYAARNAAIEASSAAGGQVDATVSASVSDREGYITNTQLNRTVDDQQVTSFAARVRVRPTANSAIAVQLLANLHRDGSQPLVPLGGPLFSVARGREGSTDSDFFGEAVTYSCDTPAGSLRATTSHTAWNLDPYDNRLVLPPTLDSRLRQTQSAWNEEVHFAAQEHAATPWHLGLWLSRTDTGGDANRAIPGLFPIEISNFSMISRVGAVFGDITFRPLSGWRVTAAVRAEETRRTFDRGQAIPKPARYTEAQTSDALLPKLTAVYSLSSNTEASFAVGAGAKPGGWSAYTDNPALARFSPEKVTSFEAGVDTLAAAKTVKLAARVFDYEIRDLQIERSFNATDYLVVNAPRARSFGGELEATWRPIATLTLTATLGVTQTTLREFTDPFTAQSYAGRRAPYSPDYDAHVALVYRRPSGVFAAVDATAIGRTFYDESENAAFAAPAHVTENAQLGYEARRWRVDAYVANLEDTQYVALIVPGVGHEVPGAPRTYGVEATLRW